MTGHDNNRAALNALMAEWANATVTYALRIRYLMGTTTGGLNGRDRLNPTTVTHACQANTLTGGSGLDWFLVKNARDGITDANQGGAETRTLLP